MTQEGLCDACHEHDDEEMGTILRQPVATTPYCAGSGFYFEVLAKVAI
jgi:hypothetical protein